MQVVVASLNPAKISAVEDAFRTRFADADLELLPLAVESGVSDQPRSDRETLQGACRRMQHSRRERPEADFWVGLEGGVEVIGGQLMAFAWIAVQGRTGRISQARSVTLPLPPAIKELVDAGLELGVANDRVFSTCNSKQKGGAYGLLTEGLHTRESVYSQAVTIALTPFVNDLYAEDDPS